MDFFDVHTYPYWVLFGWAVFPRLMFWFFSAITGGLGFWVGVFFAPHIMVAYWATHYHWDTNPALCILAWFVALSGSGSESKQVNKRIRKRTA